MFVDTSTKRHLFANLRARRGRQEDLGEVTLYAHYAPTGGCGSYIHHEYLILGKFLNFCLFLVIGPNTQKSAEQEN